jgi:hypothetical protein
VAAEGGHRGRPRAASLRGDQWGTGVVGALRAARRRRRLAGVDILEALYRAYAAGLVAVVTVLVASGATGDAPVRGLELAQVRDHGPALVGLAVAVALAVALRSAGRGGPLVLEAPDVAHLLSAPVPRRAALVGPAVRLLRFGATVGASLGAAGGVVASHRLPGGLLAWAAAGALVGAAGALLALGAGLVASGARIARLPAEAVGAAFVAWSAADLVGGTTTSPATLLGTVATFPLGVRWPALAQGLGGVALALSSAACGVAAAGGVSVERLERRSRLVAGLRVAATLRDVRAVVALRRQLAGERPRSTPWWLFAARSPLGRPGGGRPRARRAPKGPRGAIVSRDWRALWRSPVRRLARLGALGAVAGLALRGAFMGTTPLVVVGGLALYVAGLDLLSPLGEEVDHEELSRQLPRDAGWLATRHLAVPLVAMSGVATVGIAAAMAFGRPVLVAEVGIPTAVSAVPAAVLGAAVSVLRGPTGAVADPLAPELAGLRVLVGELLAPAISTIGTVAVVAARAAVARHEPALDAAVNTAFFSLLVPVAAYGWVKARGRVPEAA